MLDDANIVRRPGPQLPTLIGALPAPPETFATIEDLARRVHELRDRQGVDLRPCVAAYDGSDTFPAVNIYLTSKAGGRSLLATAALQAHGAAQLMAAIQATRPSARAA